MRPFMTAMEPFSPRADSSSKRAVEYFDSHADYYETNQYQTSRRTFVNGRHDRLIAIFRSLSIPDGARVLDAGCGPGNLIQELSRRSDRVSAIDAAPKMLSLARSRATAAHVGNVDYHVATIESLPFLDNSFDLVCSAGVIEYLPSCQRALEEFRRVLKPGGVLILPTTNVLAPAHWLRRIAQPIGRIPIIARWLGLRPGHYRTWFHFIPRFRRRVQSSGLVVERERYFYLTLPRPLDRMFPGLARGLEDGLDKYMGTWLGCLAEGYIAIARKPRTGQ